MIRVDVLFDPDEDDVVFRVPARDGLGDVILLRLAASAAPEDLALVADPEDVE